MFRKKKFPKPPEARPVPRQREAFEIVESSRSGRNLQIKSDDTFDPYGRLPEDRKKGASGAPRDLKKLSAWIKMMRELEERKKKGEDEEE